MTGGTQITDRKPGRTQPDGVRVVVGDHVICLVRPAMPERRNHPLEYAIRFLIWPGAGDTGDAAHRENSTRATKRGSRVKD